MIALNIVLYLLCIALLTPLAMFCLEVALSLWPRGELAIDAKKGINRAVLIPAHNEQGVLAATLRTLLPTLSASDRVVVVADNCTDNTAEIARAAGAEVIERRDASRRGKGFALDYGIEHLANNPPDAVVFLDADCQVAPQTVSLLGAAAVQLQRPVQGLNLCDPDPHGGALQAISGLAFRFKNLVRTLGLTRLAGLCYLTGTGMALPWALARRAKLADGNVVEDMQLGIDLTLDGYPPFFLAQARVDSPLPQQRAAARTQRTRWEHGHLRTLLRQSPRLLWLAVKHRRPALLWLALDLAIPPLSLLVGVWFTSLAFCGAAALFGASWLPTLLLGGAGTALALMIFVGWFVHCRTVVPLRALCTAPLYALSKLPIYAAFIWKRQQAWVRTERDAAIISSATGAAPSQTHRPSA